MEGKIWTWGDDPRTEYGVHTFEGKLVWYVQTSPDWAGSAAREQGFLDFLVNGPVVSVPKDIEEHVRKYVISLGTGSE